MRQSSKHSLKKALIGDIKFIQMMLVAKGFYFTGMNEHHDIQVWHPTNGLGWEARWLVHDNRKVSRLY